VSRDRACADNLAALALRNHLPRYMVLVAMSYRAHGRNLPASR
jgi:hypothetical protein